jgi:hypothetical protein
MFGTPSIDQNKEETLYKQVFQSDLFSQYDHFTYQNVMFNSTRGTFGAPIVKDLLVGSVI